MKSLFLICISVLLTACAVQDEHYYRTNPKALDQAVKNCPAQQPPKLSCSQLAAIALSMNELAYQLQMNPQGFGKQILALQESLAKKEGQLQKEPAQVELKAAIEKNKQELAERLAIVRWLESPES